ncbi:alpha/beta fold hydrolase [Angustibacter aerolatus]
MLASDGVELAVQVRGRLDGPVLLLVHGYPDTHTVWDRVVPLLEPHLRVVTYDVRGAGASGAPRRRTGYRLGQLAADLHAVAAAVSPDRPVHLVGHDWGSIQAWESVTTPGAPVASFTSVGGPCLDHLALWSRGPFTRAHLRQLRRSWYIGFFQLPVLPALLWRAGLARGWRRVRSALEGTDAPPAPALLGEAVRGVELYRANVPQVLRAPRERTTDLPVQVVQPRRDRYVDLDPLPLERWAPRLRRRHLDAGHWAQLTHPVEVARLVRELVADVEAGRFRPDAG